MIRFWYRQHQSEIRADSFVVTTSLPPYVPLNGVIMYATPANSEPGMIRLALDAKGRLIALEARPSAFRGPSTLARDNQPNDGPAKPPGWTALFSAAGLDPALLHASRASENAADGVRRQHGLDGSVRGGPAGAGPP